MDRKLAHKNVISGLVVTALGMVIFGLTFLAANAYLS
jgi:hypothetical protein